MALDTFANLKLEIADWTNRDDLTTQIGTFISLAEAEMNQVLRHPDMEATATVTMTNGLGTLPSDFLRLQTVELSDDTLRTLFPASETQMARIRQTGRAEYYTVSGNSLRIRPYNDSPFDVTIRYFQRIPALSDANTSNWVLASYPEAYLYGALSKAERFMVNDERANDFKALFRNVLKEINDEGIHVTALLPRMDVAGPVV